MSEMWVDPAGGLHEIHSHDGVVDEVHVLDMGCPHNMGSYPAEQAVVNGKLVTHYRCNGCNIILSTS